jgi:hypothetical protein
MSETKEEWLARMRSVGVVSRLSGDRVTGGKDKDGNTYKATTDDNGNTVVLRDERQDVVIGAPRIALTGKTTEDRS